MAFNADTTLGTLLVGTWANSILYTVEVFQAVDYYRDFKDDNWMLKLLVSCTIAIDSVSMFANYASVYLYTITHWGDMPYLQNQYWASHSGPPYPLYLFATGMVTAVVQIFLVVRYWRLTNNHFITFVLLLFIAVAAGGVFGSAITITIFPGFKDRGKILIPATTWLIAEAVADVSIALTLLLQLRKVKVKSSFKETRSKLNRIVVLTIQSGTAGATIALAALIAYLTNKESNLCAGIAYCMGRVYCITMLVNLNRRKIEKTWSGKTSSGANPVTGDDRGNQERSQGGDGYGGIRVHKTAMIHVDTPQKCSRGSFKINAFQPGQGVPDDSAADEIEMTVNDAASYSSKKKQDLFAP
ncbi:hypothetical protein K438DRAFT_1977394 [Mycena galopus ATCC 62051]|nr:hypothetical protein K438DRAFT_1977394 [Mycena galopus ATCC 62051]